MKNIFEQVDQLKEEINKHPPFDEHKQEQIRQYYRIGMTYSSNALEGNTLTESETKIVLEEGITIGGKRLIDHMEALGLSEAFNEMYNLVQDKELSEEAIKKLHYIFYYRINEKMAGVYRNEQVYITGSSQYSVPKPSEIGSLMAEMIKNFKKLEKDHHPVIFAALAHKQSSLFILLLMAMGRVARLLMNLILIKHGYTIAIIPPIIRHEYIRALEKAHTDDQDFIYLIARTVKDTQQDYLRLFIK